MFRQSGVCMHTIAVTIAMGSGGIIYTRTIKIRHRIMYWIRRWIGGSV
jgi:hypothetical protein